MFRKFIKPCECFTIQVSEAKTLINLRELYNRTIIKEFSRPNWMSINHPPMMQADPFLFVHNGSLHLFYEEMLLDRGLGVIKKTSTTDLKNWSKPITITHEPECHFSYPFVFEHNGTVYMMPETGCDHNIRLYKAADDTLTKFNYYKTIIQRQDEKEVKSITFDFADSCLFIHENIYYLFTSIYENNSYKLFIYYSDKFDGLFSEHPNNPVVTGNKYARCGGSIFSVDNAIFRPCQDCTKVYGGQLHLMRIKELTPTSYIEDEYLTNIIPSDEKFFKEGGHHINMTNYKGKIVIAMDARFTTTFLAERARLKIAKFLR